MNIDLLSQIQERKLVYQYTGKSLEELVGKVKVAYLGVDATAPSIHIGHLIPMILGGILSKYGVKMILLLGGATTRIGDPSGKNAMRKMLSVEEIDANAAGIRKAAEKFLPDCAIVNNADWLCELSLIDYLREVSRHVSVNELTKSEIFRKRLEDSNPLSMLEFTYPILQGYDFVHLHKEYGCNLQIGGSDQWYNILVGVDLVRRMNEAEVYGLTVPLLLTKDGRKMGKSEKGTVWLDVDLYDPFDFWQYWRNVEDEKCEECLALFTELSDKERKALLQDINNAKKVLATRLTALVHGEKAGEDALMKAEDIFEKGKLDVVRELELTGEKTLMNIVVQAGWAASNGDAKRLIEQGGVTVNEEKMTDPKTEVLSGSVVCKGKKDYVRLI